MIIRRPRTERLSPRDRTMPDGQQARGEAVLRAALSKKLEVFGDEEEPFVQSLRVLKDALHIHEDAQVVYPGSSTHVGVARVFGKECVTHVDPEDEACSVLKNAGYTAEAIGIEDYHPKEPADLMVALNSYGEPTAKMLKNVLKPGGLVITNNYTHWATELSAIEGVTLQSAMLPDYRSGNAELVDSARVPKNATEIVEQEFVITRGGRMLPYEPGERAEGLVTSISSPRYPDALFVFRAAR